MAKNRPKGCKFATDYEIMKKQIILTALCCALGATTQAQVNRPDAAGYLERGVLMFNERNYEGCIDQLARLHSLNATPEQTEEAMYYLGLATQGLGDDEALIIFKKFLADFPVSTRRADVMTSIGDFYFNRGNYAEALAEYNKGN